MGIDGVNTHSSLCVALVNPGDSALGNSMEGPGLGCCGGCQGLQESSAVRPQCQAVESAPLPSPREGSQVNGKAGVGQAGETSV